MNILNELCIANSFVIIISKGPHPISLHHHHQPVVPVKPLAAAESNTRSSSSSSRFVKMFVQCTQCVQNWIFVRGIYGWHRNGHWRTFVKRMKLISDRNQ